MAGASRRIHRGAHGTAVDGRALDTGVVEPIRMLGAMTEADVGALVERYRAGWFGHDVDAIMAVVSDDIVFHNVTAGERVEGAAAFRAHVAAIHDRWPDLVFEEHALYLAADTGVAEWTARGTAPDGRRLEWDGLDVINCRDGKITRNAVYSSGHAPRVLGP